MMPLSDANRLGLCYRHEAAMLPWKRSLIDCHTHIGDLESARVYFAVADWFGVTSTWSQTPLEQVAAIQNAFPDRIEFVAVPNYMARHEPETFTTDWLRRIEGFAGMGVKLIKFWAAPRGLDLGRDDLRLDSPIRKQAMRMARRLGMSFMVHVADPDTWFATHYRDAHKYGTKPDQYQPLERMLDEYGDVPCLAAHMAGHPEDLDHVHDLLARFPNLYVDTSATKWMVRELSRHPRVFADFCRANAGRVLFGTDIVSHRDNISEDLYASRFWCLRTLMETNYNGPSPIVDPDLSLVDSTQPRHATARLCGARLDPATLRSLYMDGPRKFWEKVTRRHKAAKSQP
ncbi:MAG: amidohydrolase family protein [Phycisphaeraceae bacterium]|nr:amidohydrolase family protein [Phycisphaeraceae bacterium]